MFLQSISPSALLASISCGSFLLHSTFFKSLLNTTHGVRTSLQFNAFSFMLPGIRILTVPCGTHCNLECCQHRAVVHSMTARTCRASDLSICLLLPLTDFVQILRDHTTTYTLRLLPQAAKLTEAEVGKNVYWLARIAMKFT